MHGEYVGAKPNGHAPKRFRLRHFISLSCRGQKIALGIEAEEFDSGIAGLVANQMGQAAFFAGAMAHYLGDLCVIVVWAALGPVGSSIDTFRRAVAEFVDHYHRERNHQGIENELIAGAPATGAAGRVHRRAQLGVLLNYYERAA
jgi:hypothetical protein